MGTAQFFGLLMAILVWAKVFGLLARKFGQPAVLGELLAGITLGHSALNILNPELEGFHLLSELGVLILLFAIGLETDLSMLLKVGLNAITVGIVGVILPFVLGYLVCRGMGVPVIPALVAGAALSATSVGITARVFADLGYLQEPEGRIVLGAAVIDDVIGLIILTVVMGLVGGQEVGVLSTLKIIGMAFGFLIVAIGLGLLIVPILIRLWVKVAPGDSMIIPAFALALGLAWLADRSGSALILGAFVAGLLLHGSSQVKSVEHGITELGHVFVPVFFVCVGAKVDLTVLNPAVSANWPTLGVGAVLIVTAVAGKFAAGFAPFWFKGRKAVIGVGMIPRGEVGLIFAEMGVRSKVFDARLFGAVTMMVIATTFVAPPILRILLKDGKPLLPAQDHEGIEDLVTGA